MQEITLETITGVHDRILAKAGGDYRIISEGNLHQMVFRANLTEDPVSRAASLFYMLCAFPAFREGNRRTACHLAEMLICTDNIHGKLPCEEVRALIRGIDTFTVEIEDVERFLLSCAGKRY